MNQAKCCCCLQVQYSQAYHSDGSQASLRTGLNNMKGKTKMHGTGFADPVYPPSEEPFDGNDDECAASQ